MKAPPKKKKKGWGRSKQMSGKSSARSSGASVTNRRHGPAVWCAMRGHLRRVDIDGSAPLEDWTPGGIRDISTLRRLRAGDRIALWTCAVLALIAIVFWGGQ